MKSPRSYTLYLRHIKYSFCSVFKSKFEQKKKKKTVVEVTQQDELQATDTIRHSYVNTADVGLSKYVHRDIPPG